jgi:hypothetical protein
MGLLFLIFLALASTRSILSQPDSSEPSTFDRKPQVSQERENRVGADLPFTTLEAEDPDNQTNGTVVKAAPGYKAGLPEYEASGRAHVSLQGEGDSIQFNHVPRANALVLRYCIPDSPEGGGEDATLSLYVNGTKRQTLGLSSRHAWLYGPAGKNGQSKDPAAGVPHTFWDESRFRLDGADLQPGDRLGLQIDPGDGAAYYLIDSIDLEEVGPPLPAPRGHFLSVKDFGAKGDGISDDTAAINRCITAATAERKIVFLPEGTYVQTAQFRIVGITVTGAGMWYTKLIGTVADSSWTGSVGFSMGGIGTELCNLSIDSPAINSRAQSGGKAVVGSPSYWKVENVWATHVLVGLWMSGATHGEVEDCRVHSTYADGINLNCGSSDNIVENNHCRGTGDDGIALISESTSPPSTGNTVRNNTVQATWWGANCDIASGTDQTVEHNLLTDNAGGACLAVSLSSTYPMHPLIGAEVEDNVLERGGGFRGSVWISIGYASASSSSFDENEITDSFGAGIEVTGSEPQDITFTSNIITNPASKGIFIRPNAVGSGTFKDNVVTDAPEGEFYNGASSFYHVRAEGNSWQ